MTRSPTGWDYPPPTDMGFQPHEVGMDDETPARKGLAAANVTARAVSGFPDEYHTFHDIKVTVDYTNQIIDMEYEDKHGGYHHRAFEIDTETMREEQSDDVILRPQRRAGDPFVEFFEEHGPFDVRK